MLEILAPTVLAAAFVAISLSAVSLALHWRNRGTPTTIALAGQVEQLRLGQIEVVDRLEHWTRRDRVRRLRDSRDGSPGKAPLGADVSEQAPEEGQDAAPVDSGGQVPAAVLNKAKLRAIARSKGFHV